jgi:hypothetical protein
VTAAHAEFLPSTAASAGPAPTDRSGRPVPPPRRQRPRRLALGRARPADPGIARLGDPADECAASGAPGTFSTATPTGTTRPWRGSAPGTGAGWNAPDVDTCHTVWVQFHEDLLATLGIPRGTDT